MNFVVKAINERPLTGNMFLNLAMEYVDSLNQKDWSLQVLSSFEKVVQIESERFSEKLFESIRDKIAKDCGPNRMPFYHDDLLSRQSRMIKSANQYLNEKLGSIVDCRNLVELSNLIEKRIRTFFKDVFKENENVSRGLSLQYLQQVIDNDISPIRINSAEDIKPHLIAQMKAEYCSVL